MKKKNLCWMAFSFFLIAASGCGSSDETTRREGAQACPNVLYPTYHQMVIHGLGEIPEKLAVTVDGILKFDSCLEEPVIAPPTPVVWARKRQDSLLVMVQHFDAYPELPAEVTFQILDRKDCASQPDVLFSAEKLPLSFKTEYPHGPSCGGKTHASLELNGGK